MAKIPQNQTPKQNQTNSFGFLLDEIVIAICTNLLYFCQWNFCISNFKGYGQGEWLFSQTLSLFC